MGIFQSEVELISLKSFDAHVRIRFGGLVMAKSVKVCPIADPFFFPITILSLSLYVQYPVFGQAPK
jgi:hypothetical protein